MSSNKFESVEHYLRSLDSTKEHTLRRVIDVIMDTFPSLECKLAWNVPQIYRGSDYIFGLSALKNHLALAPWSTDVIDQFKPQLDSDGYQVKKHLFQIPVDWHINEQLLQDMVKARLAELD